MSFVKREIDVTFTLGTGAFGEGGADTVEIKGRRASVYITVAGGAGLGELQLRIYGLTLEVMNRLSTIGLRPIDFRSNSVSVSVGDANGMSTVFQGSILTAYIDTQTMPEVSFVVAASPGSFYRIKPATPTSYQGAVDAATILADLAARMNFGFENNGVSVQLLHVYYPGSLMEQVERCAAEAHIEHIIDNQTLAIWPMNGSRGGAVPLVSATSGMVGYPTFSSQGISLTLLFRPGVQYGSTLEVKSDLAAANGKWVVYKMVYELESEIPAGSWYLRVEAGRPGYVPIQR